MGFCTAVVFGVGKDIDWNILIDELSKGGVNSDQVRIVEMDTPIANLQVAQDDSRISVNSHAKKLPGYRISGDELPCARIVSLASIFRPPLENQVVLEELIWAAKTNNGVVCADTRLQLRGSIEIGEYSCLLPFIDYLFPSEKEAAYYTRKSTFSEIAAAFRDMGIKNLVIKAGPEGCYVSGGEREYTLLAVPVPNVVDTTGEGDNFVAGFISCIFQNASLRDCADLGLGQAAKAIMHIGRVVL